jgi:Immunity protein family (Imm11)
MAMMTTFETRRIAIETTPERQDMAAHDPPEASKRARKPKARKFYVIGPSLRAGGASGYVIENEAKLLQGQLFLGPPPGRRGFPDYPEPPRLRIDKKLGSRPPGELQVYGEYWLVSDPMKTTLEAADRDACAFMKCDVQHADGEPGPVFWLCDVVRVLDALEESASKVEIRQDPDGKRYSFVGRTSLIFKEDVVGPAHIFRMAHMEPTVICDQQLKDACKAAGLKGIQFRDASDW